MVYDFKDRENLVQECVFKSTTFLISHLCEVLKSLRQYETLAILCGMEQIGKLYETGLLDEFPSNLIFDRNKKYIIVIDDAMQYNIEEIGEDFRDSESVIYYLHDTEISTKVFEKLEADEKRVLLYAYEDELE